MATLEDSFLRDLEDLSDDSEAQEEDRDAALPENNEVRVSGLTTCFPAKCCCHQRQCSLSD